ncbi:hypothetical protein RMN57_00065 [Kitasatospora sp. CM 4170]|uniref:Uncharacterized protein n=1 Tax=Kitasatospora aburaviensis TaxID=67265 RepID=A0ABW1F8P9_9ACTN|nr:hypothetical protein [Kitasatospora sp. CM 4170]WNM43206.1 hypothetical protein RMN57_00065 [Kitasatospora sp. CM 4170]
MTDHRALRILRENPELAQLAAYPFNLDLDRTDHVEPVRLASGGPLTAVAGDDTGGTYFRCPDGAILYAGSEGEAGLIADSLDEALETLIGLPCWHDHVLLDPDATDAELATEVAESEEELAEYYGPDLDADRDTLLTALGLRRIPPAELVRRLHRALRRTEPEHLLLNAEELNAYTPLARRSHLRLRETVLAPGQADLALLRARPAGHVDGTEATADPARRATTLRAAQYDRRPTDLPLLRQLLLAEAQFGPTEELRLAAVLVGRYGDPADHRLLSSLRTQHPDIRGLLGGFPDHPEQLHTWAAAFDDSNHGQDPEDEPALTWARLARRQGRTELARCALIRLLDDVGPRDEDVLPLLAHELALLGDHPQAARARQQAQRVGGRSS